MPVKVHFAKVVLILVTIAISIVTAFAICGCTGEPSNPGGRAVISSPDEGGSLYDLADEGYTELVSGDNVFYAVDAEHLFKFLEHGTGVLFLGYPECPWCQQYVAYLNAEAREAGIDKIVYYNTRVSRTEDPDSYAKLLSMLDERGKFTEYNDEGEERIFVPFLAVVEDGQITFSNNDTSHLDAREIEPVDYWTEDVLSSWKEKIAPELAQAKDAMDKCQECSD